MAEQVRCAHRHQHRISYATHTPRLRNNVEDIYMRAAVVVAVVAPHRRFTHGSSGIILELADH